MTSKVLVVDDAEAIHALIRAHFSEERIALRSAYNGETAILLAEKLEPDLILLDLNLPDIHGFEVCRRLRRNPATLYTPVIFLTASSDSEKIVHGLEIGGTDYITKPFDGAVLVARVHASLRMKSRLDFLAKRRVREFMAEAVR